jgi:hypothetical protein
MQPVQPKGETAVEVEKKQAQSPDSADSTTTQQKKAEKSKEMPVPSESTKESTKKDNSKLLVRQSSALTERPIGPSMEFAGTINVSGIRPIGVSHLEVVETINVMGIRPIGANLIHVVDSINLSGIRPIASSGLVVSETYSVMGNRPVASNEIDDSPALMGFLD